MADKKKLVELLIDEFSEKFGVQAISLVEFPAIQEDFVYFSDDNFLSLAKADEEKKILVGAVLIPDKKIPRYDNETGEEYDVYFTPETIVKAEELYMSGLKINNATYEHQIDIDGLSVVESWISEDKTRDKSTLYGFKMPVGTWFVKMKVDNDEVWKKIKEGFVKGFSIEGFFVDRIEKMSKKAKKEETNLDPFVLNKLSNLLLEELSAVHSLDGMPLFKTEQEAQIYAEFILQCDGVHKHILDGEELFMPCKDHSDATQEKYSKKTKHNR